MNGGDCGGCPLSVGREQTACRPSSGPLAKDTNAATGCKPEFFVLPRTRANPGFLSMHPTHRASGYRGRAISAAVFAGELFAGGHQVIVFGQPSHGHRQCLAEKGRLVVADLACRKSALINPFDLAALGDAVMHFARPIEAWESISLRTILPQ